MKSVAKYVSDVLSGKESAGPHVRAACLRHRRDLKRKDIFFDVAASEYAIDFFREVLVLTQGQFYGKSFKLHTSQEFIVGSIFGWKVREHGVAKRDSPRRFRRAYIEQAKGTGKTPLAAGILLYGMIADGEPGAECYAAASTGEQARICFEDALAMCKAVPELAQRLTFVGQRPCKKIQYIDGSPHPSYIEPTTSTVATRGSGFRPHFVVVDELHEHPDGKILESLERGFKWRRQPLLFMITNSGADFKSVCYEEHEHAIGVANGTREDDTSFAFVCSCEDDEDPLDLSKSDKELMKIWKKSNPLIGVTVEYDYIRRQAEQALTIPARRNRILRWNFCKWTNALEGWIDRQLWIDSEIDEDLIKKHATDDVCVGIDLSSTNDLTALAYVWRAGTNEEGKSMYEACVHSYTPRDTLEIRSKRDRTHYDTWVETGHMYATPGSKVSYDYVATRFVDTVAEAGEVKIAYDNWSYSLFEHALDEAKGSREIEQIQHPQGTNKSASSELFMPSSIEFLETLIMEQRLKVQINPPLRSAVDSATFYETASGLRRFNKPKASNRIDPLVALTMAIGLAGMLEREPDKSFSPFADMDDEEFSELYELV